MNINDIITESHHACPHCGGPLVEYSGLMEKKDACYYKVKASAKVWPSAYASGRLVQCRKKGAGNYGNKSEGVAEGSDFFAGSKFADEDGNTFSVEKIIAFAKKNPKYFHKDFPLSKIKHDLSWWQGNKERMMNADTSFPLLVIQNDDGHLGVADGLNRMKKAVDVEKKTTIDVYLVPKKDIMKFSEKQGMAEAQLDEKCWDGYQQQGMKNKSGRQVPNCVPVTEELTTEQQFDMIEDMVEHLAETHGVDSDEIWEDFESVDDHELYETAAWRRKEGKSAKGGLNAKGVASYRRENPGSKLQTAVTTKPSKLKPGSKAAKRRKSFCARMGGVKGPMKKPNGKPTRKALALRKWNC